MESNYQSMNFFNCLSSTVPEVLELTPADTEQEAEYILKKLPAHDRAERHATNMYILRISNILHRTLF